MAAQGNGKRTPRRVLREDPRIPFGKLVKVDGYRKWVPLGSGPASAGGRSDGRSVGLAREPLAATAQL